MILLFILLFSLTEGAGAQLREAPAQLNHCSNPSHTVCPQEYESQTSAEAKLVKEFDLLEMILQAHEYEELEGKPGRLQEFFDSTQGRYYLSFNLVVRADDRLYGLYKGGVIIFFYFLSPSTSGRFHHPEVIQFVKNLNEERAGHLAAGGDGSSGSSESKKPRTDSS